MPVCFTWLCNYHELTSSRRCPYVKTNLPITLLSFESTNDVWGRATNPHNSLYSPGGSTGGEAALLASGGGHIGIGSDVAGSVRVPAHNSGVYSIRCSTGRFPKMGMSTSMPGQEGIPSVFSPMARTLPDLVYFLKSILEMKPWTYDHSVHPVPLESDRTHVSTRSQNLQNRRSSHRQRRRSIFSLRASSLPYRLRPFIHRALCNRHHTSTTTIQRPQTRRLPPQCRRLCHLPNSLPSLRMERLGRRPNDLLLVLAPSRPLPSLPLSPLHQA